MKYRWDIDNKNAVILSRGSFRKTRLIVNDQPLAQRLKLAPKKPFTFNLADGRRATLNQPRSYISYEAPELRVEGQLMVETPKKPGHCSSCKAVVMPNDRFCSACGQAMPPAEHSFHKKNISKATRAIAWLAVIYMVSGMALFFIVQSQLEPSLGRLNSMGAAELLPRASDGVVHTVAEMRGQLRRAPWNVLMVNMILAGVMGGLAFWSRRAPMAAIMVAAATYAVVIVASGINDPRTIGQAIYVKIIVVVLLVRGIKAALALRTASA